MIKWIIPQGGQRKRKLMACLLDLKLVEACLSDPEIFGEYLSVVEAGKERYPTFKKEVIDILIKGIDNLNWDGLF